MSVALAHEVRAGEPVHPGGLQLLVLVEPGAETATGDGLASFLAPLGDVRVVAEPGADAARTAGHLAGGAEVSAWTPAGGLDALRSGTVLVARRPACAGLLDELIGGGGAEPGGGVHVLEHDAGGWRIGLFGASAGGAVPPPSSAAERRIILVRHGECLNFTLDGRVYAGTGLPLTERGRGQAAALAAAIDGTDAVRVHASPSERAQETARLLASGRAIVRHDRLREISLGELEGGTVADIFAAAPDFFVNPASGLPGGESFLAVADRAGVVLDAVLAEEPSRDVVLVAHGGVNRALLFRTLAAKPRRMLTVRQDWAGVNTLERRDGRWLARTINWMERGLAEIAVGRGGAPLAPSANERAGR